MFGEQDDENSTTVIRGGGAWKGSSQINKGCLGCRLMLTMQANLYRLTGYFDFRRSTITHYATKGSQKQKWMVELMA